MPALLIPARNPGPLTGPTGNNTYLIEGPLPTLIDAGVGAADHVDAISRALNGQPLAKMLATHGHGDHIGGADALRRRWPDVEFCKMRAEGDDVARWRWLKDGERVEAGDGELEVVATPGHAVDHVCFFDASSRDLFAGDMVVAGSTVMIPRTGGNLRAYLASLEKMAALSPARILPAHGPIIDRPFEIIAQYLAHRREREQQVLACLTDGLTSIDAIVARIYPGLAAPLIPSAKQTIEAHLAKIEEDRAHPPRT